MIVAYWIAGCTASSVAEAAAQTLAKAGVKPEWIDEAHQVGVVMDLDSPAQKYHWPVVSPGDHRLVNLLVRSLAARECGLMLVGQTQEGQTALALLASAAAVGGRNILARARLMPLSGHRPPHDFFNHLPEALSEVEVESEQVAWVDTPEAPFATAEWVQPEQPGAIFRLNRLAEAVQGKVQSAGLMLSPMAGLATLIQRT